MNNHTRTLQDKVFLVIKGLAMGAANKVPGVSGGIVAFVAGFYEEFIYALRKVNLKALKLLLNGRFKSFYRYINGHFLSLLFLGMLISYFSVSKLLDYFIEKKRTICLGKFFWYDSRLYLLYSKGLSPLEQKNHHIAYRGSYYRYLYKFFKSCQRKH